MKENVITSLPGVLSKYKSTLKKVSKDTTKGVSMCESDITVINFDKIPNEYAKLKKFPTVPQSNDALYVDEGNIWYFIEFKNGEVKKGDIYRKIYDSLVMLIEMGYIADLNFSRSNINYILVYNSDKYPSAQASESRDSTYGHFLSLAKTEMKLFEIEKFENYLFRETHTYTKELFQEHFVEVMKKAEAI